MSCTDQENFITEMLPRGGGFAILLQETRIATRAQGMRVAAALRDKGYLCFDSSRLVNAGSTSPGGWPPYCG